MGGASSKTSAENIANQLMSAVSEVSSGAYQINQSANVINLTGNCKIGKGSKIKQYIKINVNSDILQNISQSTQTINALTNRVKQISESEAPNLSFSAGADSETFTKLINNLATAIRNTISTTCSQDDTNTNIFNCSDFAVFEGESNQDIFANYLLKCVQNVSSVTTAKQDLQNFIDQHSTAKVEDVIFKILMAVAAIMLIYFLGPSLGKLLGGGTSSTSTPESSKEKKKTIAIVLLIALLIILILVYFLVIKK
jgi:hypothetical protein